MRDVEAREEKRKRLIREALEELEGLDLEGQARKGAFTLSKTPDGETRLDIPSFGGTITVTLPSGRMDVPERIDSLSMRVLALRYVKKADGTPPTGKWIAYRDLPGGRFYAATLVPTVEQPLAQAYGKRPHSMAQVAGELGGERSDYGDESYVFRPFPHTPLLVVLHWGDEEFEPQCRVLFDSCCPGYLNTDDLKILATQLAAYLLRPVAGEEAVENLLWMVE
ncbi:MAG: DUF3786 domain-containing protein [Candidatus Geothermincolales bacterium]